MVACLPALGVQIGSHAVGESGAGCKLVEEDLEGRPETRSLSLRSPVVLQGCRLDPVAESIGSHGGGTVVVQLGA